MAYHVAWKRLAKLFTWSQRNQNSYMFLPNNTDTSCLHYMDAVSYTSHVSVHFQEAQLKLPGY